MLCRNNFKHVNTETTMLPQFARFFPKTNQQIISEEKYTDSFWQIKKYGTSIHTHSHTYKVHGTLYRAIPAYINKARSCIREREMRIFSLSVAVEKEEGGKDELRGCEYFSSTCVA